MQWECILVQSVTCPSRQINSVISEEPFHPSWSRCSLSDPTMSRYFSREHMLLKPCVVVDRAEVPPPSCRPRVYKAPCVVFCLVPISLYNIKHSLRIISTKSLTKSFLGKFLHHRTARSPQYSFYYAILERTGSAHLPPTEKCDSACRTLRMPSLAPVKVAKTLRYHVVSRSLMTLHAPSDDPS